MCDMGPPPMGALPGRPPWLDVVTGPHKVSATSIRPVIFDMLPPTPVLPCRRRKCRRTGGMGGSGRGAARQQDTHNQQGEKCGRKIRYSCVCGLCRLHVYIWCEAQRNVVCVEIVETLAISRCSSHPKPHALNPHTLSGEPAVTTHRRAGAAHRHVQPHCLLL